MASVYAPMLEKPSSWDPFIHLLYKKYLHCITRDSWQSIILVLYRRPINDLLPPITFLYTHHFSSFFVSSFYFHHTLFSVGLCEPYSFCAFTCLSNNSLISRWILAKLVSALFPCVLYLSYYLQPEVILNT